MLTPKNTVILFTHQKTEGKHTHTHTHNTHQFNGPLSRTNRVSRYQKGKINLDFTEAVASAGPYVSLHLAPYRQPWQHLTIQFSKGQTPKPTASKHRRQTIKYSESAVTSA